MYINYYFVNGNILKIFTVRSWVIILLPLIASCSFAGDAQKIKHKSTYTNPAVAGWLPVSFSIDADYVLLHRGKLGHIYDEFVGGLFDDGLQLKSTGWLKPTYGNQNLIWTLDPSFGALRQEKLQKSIKEFQSNLIQFKSGSIIAGGVPWIFTGYIDKAQGTGSDVFQSFVFVCSEPSSGVSVFYWGEGIALEPQNNNSVIELLSKVSLHCES